MCFSVNVNLVKEELENRYNATLIDKDNYRPSYYYHAFSLPLLPVICSGKPGIIILSKWGLIPSWTKSKEDAEVIRYKTFNARAETIKNKLSYYQSFKTKRCLVPVDGFFEWQNKGKRKIPWYIYRADCEIMSIAGIFDEWVDSDTGEILNTFSIITTTANELLADIHNSGKRMPVILDKNSETLWINDAASQDDVYKLLMPCNSELLKAHTVDPSINNKNTDRNNDGIIKPYNYPSENMLF
jgi:putative SOS response-associated peptidase YedK